MAGYWKGFTEEDIGRYLKNNQEERKGSVPRREANKLQGKRERNGRVRKISTPEPESAIPEDAKLSKSETKPLMTEEVPDKTEEPAVITGSSQPVCLKVIAGNGYELVEKDPKTVSPATLEVFQARQKMLEEQNKRRKEVLAKVLNDRRKQTTEEARRLKNIQDELHKLDLMLSNDVGILRDQIESASMEFGEAQKRYNRAEKEYLDAKHTLFSKLERKELLTKHLCTIIEQNELRKAQKLSELMEKLRINEASVEPDSNAVILSPYDQSALTEESKPEIGVVNNGYDIEESTKVESCS